MAAPKVYQYPACGTCKKALTWLSRHGIAFDSVHIVESPPSVRELSGWIKRSGLPVKAFFNTSGEVYRSGGYKDRLPTMDEAAAVAALAAHGKLIKRPLIVTDSAVLVGFDEATYQRAFHVATP